MQRSVVKTLVRKHRVSVPRIYQRYRAVLQTDQGLQVTVERGEGRKPLVAQWGGVSLKRNTRISSLDDHPTQVWNSARMRGSSTFSLIPARCAGRMTVSNGASRSRQNS